MQPLVLRGVMDLDCERMPELLLDGDMLGAAPLAGS